MQGLRRWLPGRYRRRWGSWSREKCRIMRSTRAPRLSLGQRPERRQWFTEFVLLHVVPTCRCVLGIIVVWIKSNPSLHEAGWQLASSLGCVCCSVFGDGSFVRLSCMKLLYCMFKIRWQLWVLSCCILSCVTVNIGIVRLEQEFHCEMYIRCWLGIRYRWKSLSLRYINIDVYYWFT